jgi:hypothetical protein
MYGGGRRWEVGTNGWDRQVDLGRIRGLRIGLCILGWLLVLGGEPW